MRVSLLEINNFRGINTGKIAFRDHTVLIGPNNSCKTTVIEALAFVLGRDRLIQTLTEHDFFGSTPDAAARIKIIATVTGFEPQDFTQHTEWFGDRRGIPLWFDPENGSVVPTQTDARQTLACQIVFAARFNADTLEVETARYFNDGGDADIFAEENHVSLPPSLIRDIGFFLIPASRSWDRMLSFSSELFRRVIRTAAGLPARTILDERDRLRRPDAALENDERMKPIVDEVNAEMSRLLGKATPLRLRATATDSAGVLEAITPHYQTGDLTPIPAKRQGSGLVSLQSLFLLLHFGQRRIEDGESFFMALEEPELHLPPAVQRRVLGRLQALSTQTIVTTHSPLVAGYCEAASLLVVRNNDGALDVRPMLAKPLAQAATNAVRRLFQINRVETAAALMNERVLVPEGQFDFDWVTMLLRIAELDRDGTEPCLFGVRIGVVPTADAKVKETCEALSKAHPMVCGLVDGDADGTRYSDQLDGAGVGASKVLRWQDGWTIEDLVGWIVHADEATIMTKLNADLAEAPGDRTTLVARLKSDDRSDHGLKGDGVAYEIVANALSESNACRTRTRAVLHAISDACLGLPARGFTVQAGRREGQIPRLVFTPWA
ncbi:putative ATP-dependent endonuclease of OLD family [Bradyrhizobium sp. cir1]|uniref:ATP-dependent nuclease n=1 Tax=Bradyrhizobium sp. cir1 TaxID=1445730 RepID=UPI001605F96B|nr:ATP-binding protein [Bradyrhizobium sp. cir1]MBB4374129.1 putative ATP-dependent endonuclease of OLD family [Bradyrhizobium sp. cir1]